MYAEQPTPDLRVVKALELMAAARDELENAGRELCPVLGLGHQWSELLSLDGDLRNLREDIISQVVKMRREGKLELDEVNAATPGRSS